VIWTAFFGALLVAAVCGAGLSRVPDFLPGNRLLIAGSIGVAVFALAANIVLQSWAAAEGLFRPLTVCRIAQSSLIMLFPLALSTIDRTSNLLVLGHTLGLLAALGLWLRVFPRSGLSWTSAGELPAFWIARARCFIYVLPALVIGTLAGNLPQLAVNWRFGAAAAGQLALAQRVLGVPLSLVGIAVRDVFKRFASVAHRERGECAREFWNSFTVLAVIATAFGLVMFPLSEELFVLVFGEAWRMAGQIAHWLLPMFVVAIVASPLTYLVYIVKREDFDLYWQSALLVVVAASLFSFKEIETTLQVFALSYTAMYGVYMFACAQFARGAMSIWRQRHVPRIR
jgi:O-antigen/teichoic acid export membrane protein